MPNRPPAIANLNGDAVTFVAGSPVRLDAGSNSAVSDPDQFGYEVVRVGSGLTGGPLFMVEMPDGSGRMYVVEKSGTIRILDPATGAVAATPFLNVASQIATSGEQGLLGLALAPNFAASGVFYIYMSNVNGDNEVRRYATFPNNLSQADPATADRILLLPHPGATNHNAGWIAFGPDNLLYIASGDGAVGANAQSTNSLLGKILRIDPSSDAFPADADRDYAIPAGNPFAGPTAGRDEIWALGLRNPFRASFDPLTGGLWIGDVGEGRIEEIDFNPAGQGGLNFGWNVREGTLQQTGANSPAFTPPVAEYGHGSGPFQGNSVTGGLVYRGPIAGLDGHYVFGDFFDELWSVPVGSLVQGSTLSSSGFTLRNAAFTPNVGTINQISSFATDQAGNLYITDLGGEVFRVRASAAPNFAGGQLSVDIGAGEVPAEDQLGFAAGAVALSNGTNVGSQVRVDGVLVGTIAPGGTGANGEPLVVLFSSGATQARVSTLIQAATYSNAAAQPTLGSRSVTIRLVDGAGTSGGGQDTIVVTTSINVTDGLVLIGTPGPDHLVGGDGNDWLEGRAGDDYLDGGNGNDGMDGGSESDVMFGRSGNDGLAGGSGKDWLDGGAGEDYLDGGDGDDGLEGGSERDIMFGRAGNDGLAGGDGNDWLDGGDGLDYLEGGLGSDGMEGGADRDILFGGAGDDGISGSGGDDYLNGGDDVDHLDGGIGNDGLYGGGGGDILFGRAGDDGLHGEDGDDYLNGGDGADYMTGGGGNDSLDGGGGTDILTGGDGADAFLFMAAPATGFAHILDFAAGTDRIVLDDAAFGLPVGALSPAAFRTGTAAQDADDRIVYNPATGALIFDADGSGSAAAVQIASLQTGLNLAASDFAVI